jgi:hypothetical protein
VSGGPKGNAIDTTANTQYVPCLNCRVVTEAYLSVVGEQIRTTLPPKPTHARCRIMATPYGDYKQRAAAFHPLKMRQYCQISYYKSAFDTKV